MQSALHQLSRFLQVLSSAQFTLSDRGTLTQELVAVLWQGQTINVIRTLPRRPIHNRISSRWLPQIEIVPESCGCRLGRRRVRVCRRSIVVVWEDRRSQDTSLVFIVSVRVGVVSRWYCHSALCWRFVVRSHHLKPQGSRREKMDGGACAGLIAHVWATHAMTSSIRCRKLVLVPMMTYDLVNKSDSNVVQAS